MGKTLDSLVELSPGFNTAVDISGDLANEEKVAAYIPTEVASEILLDMGENLHPSASRRARLITGTYGTGKSHLGLVLTHIYRDGVNAPSVAPVLQKLSAKWPGKAAKLQRERSGLEGKFLSVLLNGDRYGSFDDSLLYCLDRALREEGLGDLLPETAFSAARERIEELEKTYPGDFKRFEEKGREYGFESAKVLKEQLRNMNHSAYEKFCRMHKEVFAGAPFYHHHLMSPTEVYESVAKRLRSESGYAGIVVIWDEFGRYMERVVKDPGGLEGQSIQEFAQRGCNNSHKNQIHLYLICHRSLQEYVEISKIVRARGMSKVEQEDWNKISGRFRTFNMQTTDKEIFQLIDQVIIQKDASEEWKAFAQQAGDCFDEWTDQASRLRIFPEFTRNEIASVVTVGAYPLHPMAAFGLPKISEKVAQNERTMFRFLSDSGEDTFGPFLRETELPEHGGAPPFFPADGLWHFFAKNVAEDPMYRRIYRQYMRADVEVSPDDELAKRILRAVALLLVIGSDRAPCTEDVLAYALGLSASQQAELREALKSLCTKEGGRERVLVQSVKDGAYRFTGTSSDDFEAKVEQTLKERMDLISPASHLRSIAEELGLDTEIPATGYSDDFMLQRGLVLELVGPEDLESSERWTQNLGGGDFYDGYALVALCENRADIEAAHEAAGACLKHPQIMLGVPNEPVQIGRLLRNHDAIRHLEKTQSHLYGEGADLREEWEQQDKDHLDAIGKVIGPLLNPESRALTWFVDGEELPNIGSRSQLRKAASDLMRKVFSQTPVIAHERLTTEEGRDSFISARRAIIDKLLKPNGAELLAKETNRRDKTVIDFVYQKNGILRSSETGYELGKPDAAQYGAMAAVWDEIEKLLKEAKEKPLPMGEAVAVLRRPPYGMRSRCLSLLFAAVLKPYIQRGNISFEYDKSKSSATRVTRVNGEVLDDAVVSWPDKYRLVYTDIGEKHDAILFAMASVFDVPAGEESDRGQLIGDIHEGVMQWWRALPAFSRKTARLDKQAMSVREKILRRLAAPDADPQEMLLNVLAEAIQPAEGKEAISPDAVSDLFGRVKGQIDTAVEQVLLPRLNTGISQVFAGKNSGEAQPSERLRAWYAALPDEKREMRLAGDATVLIQAARKADKETVDDDVFVREIAKAITGMEVENWGDEMVDRFLGRLESARKAVEEAESSERIDGGDENTITIWRPKQGQISIVVADGSGAFRRVFVPVSKISPGGENLRRVIEGAIEGIGRTLPTGECETILVEVLRDILK